MEGRVGEARWTAATGSEVDSSDTRGGEWKVSGGIRHGIISLGYEDIIHIQT